MNSTFTAEAGLVVTTQDTARNIALAPTDSFPEVFSTSRMIAATPVGSRVRAVATYLRTEAKLIHFNVEAFDEAGSIGVGEHARAIVDTDRLLAGAARRRNGDMNS